MVLARTYTNLEDYSAAIDTYGKSIAIRPDRADLYIARAELEKRLMRFDDAAADYEHIYQLAYKDPQWMEKLASVRARQGKTQAVVTALQAALIEGRPENPANFFEVARRLETWGMLEQARAFAEQGISQTDGDLLAGADNREGTKTYVRIMTRLRQHENAYPTLQKALEAASADLPVLKEQVRRQGITGLTDAQWRENMRHNRIDTARTGMASALQEMGTVVNMYFTPEERLGFARFAESIHNVMSLDDVETFTIPLAVNANLADQEAHWRFDSLMRRSNQANRYLNTQPLVDLQRRRGRFVELATQMEQLAAAIPWTARTSPLLAAADAYHSAGDEQNELRVLSAVFSMSSLDPSRQERLFQLLLERQPDELVRIASRWPAASSEQAANYAVVHGSAALAHAVVEARSKERPPVWNKAYSALVGLYFAEPTPQVNNSFLGALGDDPIGARLNKPVDRAQQLAGNTWFYYGSRYGEYLGVSKVGNAEDFLPAILEESPVSSSGYQTLAEYYTGAGDSPRAIADYNHTLELSPDRPDLYDSLALAYLKQGDRSAALAQWKQAFAVLSKQLNSARVPESFWRDFGRTCDQLRTHHLFSELKPDADAIVRTYLRHNGTWMSNAVLHPAYAAQLNSAAATAWLVDMSSSASDPARVLADVADASWIPLAQRAPIYQRILELKQDAVGKSDGVLRQNAQYELGTWQERWIQYLVRTKQYSAAASAIAALPQETRDAQNSTLIPLEIQVAAQLGTLDSMLEGYRVDPSKTPNSELLRTAARQLFSAGDKQSARKILEIVFAREIEEHKLVASNFLGLAEIRLASGDSTGALHLLRRLSVAVGAPFENLDSAAGLLEKTGHNAEAVEFLEQLVTSAPWEPAYRLRLAKARLVAGTDASAAVDSLATVASAQSSAYDIRLKAATAVGGHTHADLGSGELNLLAGDAGAFTAAAADKFYFYEARIKAAEKLSDTKLKIQLLSHCVIDFPRRNPARVPLFQASAGEQSDRYALAILEQLFQTQFLHNPPAENEGEQIVSSVDEEESAYDGNILSATETQLSRAQQAQVSQMIADVMMRLSRPADALSYYQTARRLEKSPAVLKTLNQKIAAVKTTLRVQRENAARQPILHESLEQDRVVRPRLLARAAPPTQAATAERGAKQ